MALPAPPEPGVAEPQAAGPPGSVALSDLPWRSARAGWTATGDNLPRRDRDVQQQPLRLPWLPVTEHVAIRLVGDLATSTIRWATPEPA